MTGAEHYQEAETLLVEADRLIDPHLVSLAQVHATLALAAATVQGADWFDVTSGSTS